MLTAVADTVADLGCRRVEVSLSLSGDVEGILAVRHDCAIRKTKRRGVGILDKKYALVSLKVVVCCEVRELPEPQEQTWYLSMIA